MLVLTTCLHVLPVHPPAITQKYLICTICRDVTRIAELIGSSEYTERHRKRLIKDGII